ncbi:lipopolysaccharide core heptose(II) kinase RfaY, partial [Pseudescherichia sp.]
MSVAFSRKQGFEIYQRINDDDFTALLTQYKNNQIPVHKLASGSAARSVAIIASEKRKYILKEDRERDKRLEKKIANFIFGPFQSRLIKLMDRAVNEGCHVF